MRLEWGSLQLTILMATLIHSVTHHSEREQQLLAGPLSPLAQRQPGHLVQLDLDETVHLGQAEPSRLRLPEYAPRFAAGERASLGYRAAVPGGGAESWSPPTEGKQKALINGSTTRAGSQKETLRPTRGMGSPQRHDRVGGHGGVILVFRPEANTDAADADGEDAPPADVGDGIEEASLAGRGRSRRSQAVGPRRYRHCLYLWLAHETQTSLTTMTLRALSSQESEGTLARANRSLI